MKCFIAFILLAILIVGCKKEDIPEPEMEPCSELVDGVYIYPTEKPDTSLSRKEIKEYWNIPEDILKCISTEGLLKSCYNTMYTIFVSASNGYQAGYYLVTRWNRGFDELESRTDAPQILIDYWSFIKLPHTIDYGLFVIEVLLSQDNILKELSVEQKSKLLDLSLNYHIERRNIFNRSGIIYDGTVVIMARLMKYDNYKPFIDALNSIERISIFTEGLYTYNLSLENADTIVFHTKNYLNSLSN